MQTVGAQKSKSKSISNKTLVTYIVTILFAAVLYGVFQFQNATDKDLLEKAESSYGNIYIYRDGMKRIHMVFGYRGRNFTESVYNPTKTHELALTYTRFLTLGLAYVDNPQDMLSIGMGGTQTSSYMEASVPQLRITEAELDPEVVRLAGKYFDFKETPRHKVVVEDGRRFLMDSKEQYDLIVIDAYRGPFVPFHLLTTEFFKLVKEHLKPGGAVVQNIAPATVLFDSTVLTLRSVFDHVDLYSAKENIIAIAYDGAEKRPHQLRMKAIELQKKYDLRYSLVHMLESHMPFHPKSTAKVLTDDFAPVDALKAIDSDNHKWQ